MKIVHVEEFFYPQAGYQINLLAKYMAKAGHEVVIVSSEIDKLPNHLSCFFGKDNIDQQDLDYENKYNVKVFRRPVYGYFNRRNFYRLGFLNYLNTLEFIKDLNPDILYVHGNDTIFGILSIIQSLKWKFPLLLDSHMLDMAAKGDPLKHIFRFLYKNFITPTIKRRKLTIIRTQNDDYVERFLGIPLSQAPFISVGSDILLFKPDDLRRKRFRKENKISDNDFVVIYTGKLIESKGGLLLANAFEKKFVNSKGKNVVLMIIGSIPEGKYGERIKVILNRSQNRVIAFPTQKYSQLAEYYQASDLSVFPMQCSLSFYDAQACGLPVVSEDNAINVQRLQNKNGLYFQSGDVEDFRQKILQVIELSEERYAEMCYSARRFILDNYSYEHITAQYLNTINQVIQNYKGETFNED